MANEIYSITHFGSSRPAGFGSIYHYYLNTIITPEEPIVITPPVVVVPSKPEEPEEPTKPEEPKKKEINKEK